MSGIHPTAIVDSRAEIASTVQIGPYAIVGSDVVIGADTVIHAYAQVVGKTRLGKSNVIHSHCVIGGPPQDKKYGGEPTALEIGDQNTFRECCTVNLGTIQDGGITRIGSNNWIMAYVHIAHDCQVGSHTIMANATQLAGHVVVGDWAILGGITGVHQFVKIGAHAMTGAGTTLLQDLPPYVMANGNPAAAHGINAEGLKRRGFTPSQIAVLRRAYKLIYKSGLTLAEALDQLADAQTLGITDSSDQQALDPLIAFLRNAGRGIVR
ncbi:MAG: acyl-ACP--UDP-N-acetylglucosamine O-acyltransferase [Burkholderiaceae bacterium]|nr:acyl-ACP--UDP-N-acetylglucosamine O-acyltransferase [Burkholderiaceae bacterium]